MNCCTTARCLVRRTRFLAMTALLAALVVLATPLPAAHASEFVVDTDADNVALDDCTVAPADCSLRGAISRANATTGVDTITFAASTNGLPIYLVGAIGDDLNASGDLDILSSGDLTIQGNGAANTIIDGSDNDRVFHVCPGGGCASSLTMTGVTIRHGRLRTGGGIYNEGGTTTVDSCFVSANGASYGGGIYNEAMLLVRNGSTIGGAGQGNAAQFGGGGIYNAAGTTTLDGSTVSDNEADSGGGIYNEGTLHVQNHSTIGGPGAGNEATSQDGGGIMNAAGGTVIVDGSTIDDNSADEEGGGIHNLGRLRIQNGSVIGEMDTGNHASGAGGGVSNGSGGLATIDGSTVIRNSALGGGGIFNRGTLTITVSIVSANGAGLSGGGIENGGILTVTGSTIGSLGAGNNVDDNGGGISNGPTGRMTLEDSTVSANQATSSVGTGGGIYNRGVLTVTGSTIGGPGAGNEAGIDGGGILNGASGSITMAGSTVSANEAVFGGGIRNSGTMIVSNSTIGGAGAGNQATDRGGGIYHGGGTSTVTGSCILHNWATISGGGLYNDENVEDALHVTGSSIAGNRDVSFLNTQTHQQTATGNWWGAATGPNTPGADTVGGFVNTSGHLTTTIVACSPELQVDKANDTGGNGTFGTPFHWILTVANSGVLDAVFAAGQRLLEDDLPAGPTYGAPVAGSFEDITNSENIGCTITDNTLTCQATGGDVTLAATTGRLAVVLSVTPRAGGALTNPAGNCRVDPDGHVTEGDEANNDCPADTVDVFSWTVYLPLVLR